MPAYASDLAKKLNLPAGMKTRVLSLPPEVALDGLEMTDARDAASILLFARDPARPPGRHRRRLERAPLPTGIVTAATPSLSRGAHRPRRPAPCPGSPDTTR